MARAEFTQSPAKWYCSGFECLRREATFGRTSPQNGANVGGRPAGRPQGQVRQTNATCRKRVADGTSVFCANFPRGKIAEKYGKFVGAIPALWAVFGGGRSPKPLVFKGLQIDKHRFFYPKKPKTPKPMLRDFGSGNSRTNRENLMARFWHSAIFRGSKDGQRFDVNSVHL